jgi:hypothetical protein
LANKQSERVDPPRRSAGTVLHATSLDNQDPNKHYVWASLTTEIAGIQAVDYYENIGYDVELHKPGGVVSGLGRTARERKAGQRIEQYGCVLMSCSLERKAEIDQYGPDGDGGQQRASELEQKYLRQGGRDLMRGMNPNSAFVRLHIGADHSAPVPLGAGAEK